ncbi:phage shock protein C (PspC) family protein [Homoserinimonas aerilata]|uniref:Phage shock protein C (PspC) family protein n=1 Tax=Homoserinimonas aerilata TaxID=1162970 RepID=A0A542YHW4_9MICO|nr:PspC domain-containing protein [Homoserinimonas aerilata]TQL47679.1 phage shock protein C (PspC) family protein [Homoserinimonas aerilata]
MSTLQRPRDGRVLAGVCAGIALRFDLSPTLVRWIFALCVLFAGMPILIYILLWVLMPEGY